MVNEHLDQLDLLKLMILYIIDELISLILEDRIENKIIGEFIKIL
jgi:hypothetical protein